MKITMAFAWKNLGYCAAALFMASAMACSTQGSGGTASPSAKAEGASVSGNEKAAAAAELGKPAPNFKLKDLDGNTVELSQLKGKIVVLEWFNPECPFVKANHSKGSLKGMAARFTDKGIVWLAINSGAPGKQGHGAEANKKGKESFGMNYPILLDESGEIGKMYGARTTPHMYIVDAQGVLVYRGAIDNTKGGEPEPNDKIVNYVESALGELSAGKAISTAETESYGCSVKYASK